MRIEGGIRKGGRESRKLKGGRKKKRMAEEGKESGRRKGERKKERRAEE